MPNELRTTRPSPYWRHASPSRRTMAGKMDLSPEQANERIGNQLLRTLVHSLPSKIETTRSRSSCPSTLRHRRQPSGCRSLGTPESGIKTKRPIRLKAGMPVQQVENSDRTRQSYLDSIQRMSDSPTARAKAREEEFERTPEMVNEVDTPRSRESLNLESENNSYPESKNNSRPGSKNNSNPGSKNTSNPESKNNSNPESKNNSNPGSKNNSNPESKNNSNPGSKNNSNPESKSNSLRESQQSLTQETPINSVEGNQNNLNPETNQNSNPETRNNSLRESQKSSVQETQRNSEESNHIQTPTNSMASSVFNSKGNVKIIEEPKESKPVEQKPLEVSNSKIYPCFRGEYPTRHRPSSFQWFQAGVPNCGNFVTICDQEEQVMGEAEIITACEVTEAHFLSIDCGDDNTNNATPSQSKCKGCQSQWNCQGQKAFGCPQKPQNGGWPGSCYGQQRPSCFQQQQPCLQQQPSCFQQQQPCFKQQQPCMQQQKPCMQQQKPCMQQQQPCMQQQQPKCRQNQPCNNRPKGCLKCQNQPMNSFAFNQQLSMQQQMNSHQPTQQMQPQNMYSFQQRNITEQEQPAMQQMQLQMQQPQQMQQIRNMFCCQQQNPIEQQQTEMQQRQFQMQQSPQNMYSYQQENPIEQEQRVVQQRQLRLQETPHVQQQPIQENNYGLTEMLAEELKQQMLAAQAQIAQIQLQLNSACGATRVRQMHVITQNAAEVPGWAPETQFMGALGEEPNEGDPYAGACDEDGNSIPNFSILSGQQPFPCPSLGSNNLGRDRSPPTDPQTPEQDMQHGLYPMALAMSTETPHFDQQPESLLPQQMSPIQEQHPESNLSQQMTPVQEQHPDSILHQQMSPVPQQFPMPPSQSQQIQQMPFNHQQQPMTSSHQIQQMPFNHQQKPRNCQQKCGRCPPCPPQKPTPCQQKSQRSCCQQHQQPVRCNQASPSKSCTNAIAFFPSCCCQRYAQMRFMMPRCWPR
ncbi:putative mediator of RNA polymerase II transcription subunit 26 [Drosophila ficusphila]|uniref:putative mediator of RNA polymerase II transcription subunit 26 n=1 Tax=Drosophila ficusphila TaxID=30025 RepID=UPI0007E65292|nr:putative mediator of RNA polymerase II transcription subunit 26 [Drosophila ficusphila]